MKYELVETPDADGFNSHWHARMVANNGEIVWWTEHYTTKRAALDAIDLVKVATHYDGRTLRLGYTERVEIIEVVHRPARRAPTPELPPQGQMP